MVQLGSGVEGHDGFAAPDGLRLASSSYDFHVYLGHRAKNAVSVHVAGEVKIAIAAAGLAASGAAASRFRLDILDKLAGCRHPRSSAAIEIIAAIRPGIRSRAAGARKRVKAAAPGGPLLAASELAVPQRHLFGPIPCLHHALFPSGRVRVGRRMTPDAQGLGLALPRCLANTAAQTIGHPDPHGGSAPHAPPALSAICWTASASSVMSFSVLK